MKKFFYLFLLVGFVFSLSASLQCPVYASPREKIAKMEEHAQERKKLYLEQAQAFRELKDRQEKERTSLLTTHREARKGFKEDPASGTKEELLARRREFFMGQREEMHALRRKHAQERALLKREWKEKRKQLGSS